MELDPSALVMGTRDVTNGSINGRPFQQEALVTFNGYQFAAWYHQGGLSLRLGRRSLDSETWEVVDTGFLFQNGAQFWDSHNCVSMGISGDGRIHLVFDLHSDVLRYVTTELGYATSSSAVWAAGRFVAERNSLNPGEPRVPGGITYPRLSKLGGGDLAVTFREGGAPNGEHLIAAYDSNTGLWASCEPSSMETPARGCTTMSKTIRLQLATRITMVFTLTSVGDYIPRGHGARGRVVQITTYITLTATIEG
jgi:hypothetical protein